MNERQIVRDVKSLMSGEICMCDEIHLENQQGRQREFFKICESLLLDAAEKGNEDIVRRLLEHRVNANVKSDRGETALFLAAKKGHVQIAKHLLDYGIEVDTAVTSRCNYETRIETPLTVAIEKGFFEIVQLLLEFGADIDYEARVSRYADTLCWAASKNQVEIFKLLLEQGTDAQIKEAASTAARRGNFEAVTLLLNNGFEVNNRCGGNNKTMLHEAAGAFISLLSKRTDVLRLTKLLLDKGANVNEKDNEGMTPLLIAAGNQDMKVVELLIDFGANIHDVSNDGYSCLNFSLETYKDASLFKYFLDLGVDMESVDDNGDTVLSIAVGNNVDINRVKFLLNHGANINIEDADGTCIIEITERNYNYKTGKLLISHIVQMQSNNLYVSEKNLTAMKSNRILNAFRIHCKREVAKLKSEVIPGSSLRVYDLLATNSIKKFTAYARNESMMKIVKSDNFKTNFLFYSTTILDRFENGIARNELFESFKSFFNFLSTREEGKLVKLPVSCLLDQIFDYLSDMDVKKLLKAVSFDNEISI